MGDPIEILLRTKPVIGTAAAGFRRVAFEVVDHRGSQLFKIGIAGNHVEDNIGDALSPVHEISMPIQRLQHPFPGFFPHRRRVVDHPVNRHGADAELPGDPAQVRARTLMGCHQYFPPVSI
ncbi:hypothetical protein SDC9_169817 [bioreactor metagenome]|uniref:Uncharacterized protein n=1 Tax=bioreactor metagenome TaxID=1076179 RepID=A0A645GEK9_9ZZZZ